MKHLLVLFTILFLSFNLFATHNMGGRIEARYLSGATTYRIVITTYTDISGVALQADRPVLDSIHFGDGNISPVARTGFTDLPQAIRINTYETDHTFPGPGTYLIHFSDPNHKADIVNIPHSISQVCYLETELVITATGCRTNTPHMFINPPLIFPVAEEINVAHTAFDYERDSLTYELIGCLEPGRQTISGYTIPGGVSVNPITGEFHWRADSMHIQGIFSFAIKTSKWRRQPNSTVVSLGFVVEEFLVILTPSDISDFGFDTSLFIQDSNGNFSSIVQPDSTFNLHLDYYNLDTNNHMVIQTNMYDSSDAILSGIGDTVNLDFSWKPSSDNISRNPYSLIVRGLPAGFDLVYLVYVDGVFTDSCFSVIEVGEINQEQAVRIYPNPSREKLYIDLDGYTEICNVILYDVDGRIVLSEKQTSDNSGLFIGNLNRGVYFMNVSSEKFSVCKKVIIE